MSSCSGPGEVRIGLAICDPTGTIARPLQVLRHKARAQDAERIVEIASEHQAEVILVGMALDAEGEAGYQLAVHASVMQLNPSPEPLSLQVMKAGPRWLQADQPERGTGRIPIWMPGLQHISCRSISMQRKNSRKLVLPVVFMGLLVCLLTTWFAAGFVLGWPGMIEELGSPSPALDDLERVYLTLYLVVNKQALVSPAGDPGQSPRDHCGAR